MTTLMMRLCLFGILLSYCGFSFSQEEEDTTSFVFVIDSTDLTIVESAPVLLTAEDSILVSTETHTQLGIDFSVSDTVNFDVLHLELATGPDHNIILCHEKFSLADLTTAGKITDWLISIGFGNLEKGFPYRVSVVLQTSEGILSNEIHKTITP